MREQITRVAPSASTVLIQGTTGTGKELIARCLHQVSPRCNSAFVPVDCASISGPLCSSQLFGHVKGAFTGADYASLGCFRAAEGGTIFLDEVGELEPTIQAMLLRCLQERCVVPVGNHDPIPVNVRVIAATNRDLGREVHDGNFRLDLLYRLRVVTLGTMPLRDRPEDIPLLAEQFLEDLASENGWPAKSLCAASLDRLLDHDWPGNVRELQNVLESAAILSDEDVIQPQALRIHRSPLRGPPAPHCLPAGQAQSHPVVPTKAMASDPVTAGGDASASDRQASARWRTLPEVEAEHIKRTLQAVGYNQSAAARMLAIDRHVLARKMKKYGLRKPGTS